MSSEKDKDKKNSLRCMAAAFVHMITVGLFFIVHHIYRTTGKNVSTELMVELVQCKRNKEVQQRNLINIKLT